MQATMFLLGIHRKYVFIIPHLFKSPIVALEESPAK